MTEERDVATQHWYAGLLLGSVTTFALCWIFWGGAK